MKKINLIIIAGILLVGIASASLFVFNLTSATFIPESNDGIIHKQEGVVTFLCGGKPMELPMSEPNMDIDDDFENEVKTICGKQVTNVEDWIGRTYQKNDYGLRSFDEDKLKDDECSHEGMSYNVTSNDCYKKPSDRL